MWRVLLALILVAGTAAAGYRFYTLQAPIVPGETVAVARGNITATVSATGKVEPRDEVKLSFKIGGRLKTLGAAEGQKIEKGQPIAEMEPGTLKLAVDEAQTSLTLSRLKLQQARRGTRQEEIDAARSQMDAAEARLDNLRARPRPDEIAEATAVLDKAKVAVENAQTAYDRVSWAPNINELSQARQLHVSTIELQAAQATYDRAARGATPEEVRAAESEMNAARAKANLAENGPLPDDIAILETEVELAGITLAKARAALEDTRLLSPIAGSVLTVPVKPGEYVSPQQTIVTVGNLGALRLRAEIDEVDVGVVDEGQDVSLTFDAFRGQKVTGKITAILPDAKVKAGATVYEAFVDFPAELPVRPRMAADITIAASRKEGVLLLPNRAIQTVGRKKIVEILEGDRIARRNVEVGLSDDTQSEIVAGLAEGDPVLIR